MAGAPRTLMLCGLLAASTAGPLYRLPREADDYPGLDLSAYNNFTANEVCFSDDQVFPRGAVMPNPGPCEECRCEPPSIVCHMVKCPGNNNGCRTIQRPNHCCPDYNCECDYNGQLYGDGEKMELPEDPCRVCYCKGGEVMCTSVTCYTRDDCDPVTVPGQCCPKYENCPVRDMAASNTNDLGGRVNRTSSSLPKREMQPWLLTPDKSVTQTKVGEAAPTEGEPKPTPEDLLTSATRDAPYQTARPLPEELTTLQHRPGTLKKSDTTPVDEVIFTRVDMLRKDQPEKHSVPTYLPSVVYETTANPDLPTMSEGYSEDTTIGDDLTTTDYPLASEEKSEAVRGDFISGSDYEAVNREYMEKTDDISTTVTTILDIKDNKAGDTKEKLINSEPSDSKANDIETTSATSPGGTTFTMSETTQYFTGNTAPEESEPPTTADSYVLKGNINKEVTSKKGDLYEEIKPKGENKITLEHLFERESADSQSHENEFTTDLPTTYNAVNDIRTGTGGVTEVGGIKRATDYLFTSVPDDNLLHEESKDLAAHMEAVKNKNKDNISLLNDKSTSTIEDTTTTFESTETTTHYFTGDYLETHNHKAIEMVKPAILTQDVKSDLDKNKYEQKTQRFEGTEFESTTMSDLYISTTVINTIPALNIPIKIKQEMQEDNTETPLPFSADNKETSTTHTPTSSNIYIIEETKSPNVYQDIPKESSEKKDYKKHILPILDLNSYVPYLQLGGQGSSDVSDSTEYDTETSTSHSNFAHNNSKIEQIKVIENKPSMTESDILINEAHVKQQGTDPTNSDDDTIPTTSHIPLTPGDLKTIAEYLIKEEITPVMKNDSMYQPNQWLKGNLTSQQKIASILSAANVSIEVMNQTETSAKLISAEMSAKTKEMAKAEKYEKEIQFKDNSILNNGNSVNKTGIFYNKYNIPKGQVIQNAEKDDSDMRTEENISTVSFLHDSPLPTPKANFELSDDNLKTKEEIKQSQAHWDPTITNIPEASSTSYPFTFGFTNTERDNVPTTVEEHTSSSSKEDPVSTVAPQHRQSQEIREDESTRREEDLTNVPSSQTARKSDSSHSTDEDLRVSTEAFQEPLVIP